MLPNPSAKIDTNPGRRGRGRNPGLTELRPEVIKMINFTWKWPDEGFCYQTEWNLNYLAHYRNVTVAILLRTFIKYFTNIVSPQDKPIITTLQKKWRFREAGKLPEATVLRWQSWNLNLQSKRILTRMRTQSLGFNPTVSSFLVFLNEELAF